MADLQDAKSTPFKIKLPSGTELYGFTETTYIQENGLVKPERTGDGSRILYWTEVSRSDWKGPDSEAAIQYAPPGTGSPKFYNLQGVYNRDGDGKWNSYYAGTELQQEFAKYEAGKPTQISTVVATGPKAVALATGTSSNGLFQKLFKPNSPQTVATTPDGRIIPPGTSPTGVSNIPPAEAGAGSPAGPGPADNPVGSTFPTDIKDPDIKSQGTRTNYKDYVYPTSIKTNKQDFIQFRAYEYVGRDLNNGGSTATTLDPNLGFNPRKIGISLGSVTLPIQPSITDSNSVQWGGEEMNALGAYAASVSYNAQTDIAGTGERVLKDLDKIFKAGNNTNVNNAVRLFLAGKAAGVNGLLSRVGGAVLNPNLELLFQGPQLRPFNFTFRLSPRDKEEAQQVKYIIRYFKQNMSVKNTEFNLFLKAPNIFTIKYHLSGNTGTEHPSLNRIKYCALQSCSVDYTPDGSYMTFNDSSATMTSYNLSLQFQELEPVTEKDYQDLKDETIIGY